MKKIVCLLLTLITVCASLVACGAGGDTNMHKIMDAIHKENAIRASVYPDEADCYEYRSLSELPYHNGWDNVNYESIEAWADNVYYGHHILFHADRVEIRQNSYLKTFDTKIYWNSKDNTISIALYQSYAYHVWNNEAADPQHHAFLSSRGFQISSSGEEDAELLFDMNVYYEKGKFEVSDATYDMSQFTVYNPGKITGCEELFVGDMVELLNDALNGLDGVYAAKGYPIK